HPIGLNSEFSPIYTDFPVFTDDICGGSPYDCSTSNSRRSSIRAADRLPPPVMAARILIVDDNRVVGGLLRTCVERQNWGVFCEGENGEEAITKAQELKPDIIILDLAMPVMDGLSAARELGKILPATPILLHTLHDSPDLQLEAKKAGIREIIPKSESG